MPIKFSIIMASYNSASTILQAIDSLESQCYKNYEVIFIDGASTDGTLEIIKTYSKKFDQDVTIVSEADKGIYDALNKGVELAQGEVVAFLHSDDVYFNEFVLGDVNDTFTNQHVDTVYADLVYVHKSKPDKVVRYWKSGDFTRKKLRHGWMPPHPAFFVKRSVYEKVGNFNLSYKIASDYDFMVRVLFNVSVSTYYLEKPLVKMTLGGASNRSLQNIIIKSKEDLSVIKKNGLGGIYTLFMKNVRKVPQFF